MSDETKRKIKEWVDDFVKGCEVFTIFW